MMNVFEKATKDKIRFEYKGLISTEDLWDLGVTELDSIFKVLNGSKKQLSEESLLEVAITKDTLVNTQIKIITHIVGYKLAEKDARLKAVEKREMKQKIMAVMASKEDDALEKKSPAALKKMLDEL